MKRFLALAGFLLSGIVFAEAAPELPDREPVALRLRDLAKEAAPEVATAFGESTKGLMKAEKPLSKVLKVGGKYLKFGGNFLFAASMVNDAMHWFYDEAKKSANPTVDNWWKGGSMPQTWPYSNTEGSLTESCRGSTGNYGLYAMPSDISSNWFIASVGDDGSRKIELVSSPSYLKEQIKSYCGPEKKLADINQADVRDALGKIIPEYIQTRPNLVRPQLSPTPNDNQFNDNPYADPEADSDGDGFTDAKEFERGTDPNDPKSFPQGDKDKVVKVTTKTTKNPDGSTTTVKEITYGDGSKKRITTTVKTTVKDNGDGTQTKTTTTKTKTEDLNPDGTPKGEPKEETKVEEETEDKEEAAKDEKECLSRGGTWNVDTSSCENEQPCPVGQERVDGKCQDKKKDEPVSNECGNMDPKRFLKYPNEYLKDLVIPCESLPDMFKPISDAASTKFPFSLTANLDGGLVSASGAPGAMTAVLPAELGPFKLDWSKFTVLLATVPVLFKAILSWIGINTLINKFGGQVVIK